MAALCRDCLAQTAGAAGEAAACPACGSGRIVRHDELASLTIAHLDCDAFYASVEKRSDPSLAGKPVVVGGGGKRGVVMAACYVARGYGLRSAMPMFKALAACPDAVVIRPDMAKYARVAGEVRALMREVTPLVEPISIDEAFLDLAGTERLHAGSAARSLARLALRIERRLGLTVSVGLSYNKFLAKVASALDKPRGYAVVGRAEAVEFLAGQPVGVLWGVGPAMQARLKADGIERIGDLQVSSEAALARRYGALGRRLARFSRGIDPRPVGHDGERKSLSAERTFAEDVADREALRRELWPLCEAVSARLKTNALSGRTVTLKLKSADRRLRTRSATLADPTQLADRIYRAAARLLDAEADGVRFRLIGVGVSRYATPAEADPEDLADAGAGRRKTVERAIDAVREKFGDGAIGRGRGPEPKPR